MNNTKTTKRALLTSAFSMIICVAMLIGTTFAWFNDSASTAVNKIQAGTLEVGLEMKNAEGRWVNADGETLGWVAEDGREQNEIFWEPGCTYKLPTLKITNKGNLALQFKVLVNGISGDMDLLNALEFSYAFNWMEEDSYRIDSGDFEGSAMRTMPYEITFDKAAVAENMFGIDDVAEADFVNGYLLTPENPGYYSMHIGYYTLQAHMKESAGNKYQGKALEDLSITIVATQVAGVEMDSFNDIYDENATYEIPVNPNAQTVNFTNYATDTEFVLNNYTDLKAFANELNVNGKSFSGKTVKLGADIDLANTEWTPIGQTGGNGTTTWFQGTFDGDNHTIKNLAISASAWNEGANYAAGLFGFIDADGATIKNLTIDGARVEGHHWTGAVVGYLTGTVENCHVKNATIISTHANDDACGDKVGAVVGLINTGDSVVSGCTAYKCTIKAGRDAGQIVGCNTVGAPVTGCSAEEVTVEATGDCTDSNAGGNIKNEIVGRT